jgi:AcrR family transcriptional regulator
LPEGCVLQGEHLTGQPFLSLKRKTSVDRKQSIKQAALELFTAKGFHATPTAEVAQKANVSEGAIFYYFPSKEGILQSIFEDAIEGFLKEAYEINNQALTGLQALENFITYHLARLEEKPQESLLLIRDLPAHPSLASPRFRRSLLACMNEIKGLLIMMLERGQKDGSIKTTDPRVSADLIHALLTGLSRLRLLTTTGTPVSQVDVLDFCRRALA